MRSLVLLLALGLLPATAAAQDRRPLWGEATWLTIAGAIPISVGVFLTDHPDDALGGAAVATATLVLGGLGGAIGAAALGFDLALPRSGAERQVVEALLLCATGVEVFATLLPLTVALAAPAPSARDGSDVLGPIAGLVLQSAAGIAALLGAIVAIDGAVDLFVTPRTDGVSVALGGAL